MGGCMDGRTDMMNYGSAKRVAFVIGLWHDSGGTYGIRED